MKWSERKEPQVQNYKQVVKKTNFRSGKNISRIYLEILPKSQTTR